VDKCLDVSFAHCVTPALEAERRQRHGNATRTRSQKNRSAVLSLSYHVELAPAMTKTSSSAV